MRGQAWPSVGAARPAAGSSDRLCCPPTPPAMGQGAGADARITMLQSLMPHRKTVAAAAKAAAAATAATAAAAVPWSPLHRLLCAPSVLLLPHQNLVSAAAGQT